MPKPVSVLKSIENTAIKLFAQKGIKEVTIKDIASEAKCSEGALYRHYKSKDELAWSLYKREVENFGYLLKGILKEKTLSNENKIHRSIELFYTFYDKNPTKFSFILLSQYNFPRELKVNISLNPYYLMQDLLKNMTRGKKKIDINLLSGMIYSLVLEPARMKSTNELKGRLKDRTDTVFKAVLNLINFTVN